VHRHLTVRGGGGRQRDALLREPAADADAHEVERERAGRGGGRRRVLDDEQLRRVVAGGGGGDRLDDPAVVEREREAQARAGGERDPRHHPGRDAEARPRPPRLLGDGGVGRDREEHGRLVVRAGDEAAADPVQRRGDGADGARRGRGGEPQAHGAGERQRARVVRQLARGGAQLVPAVGGEVVPRDARGVVGGERGRCRRGRRRRRGRGQGVPGASSHHASAGRSHGTHGNAGGSHAAARSAASASSRARSQSGSPAHGPSRRGARGGRG
jgi:hypothetical protein